MQYSAHEIVSYINLVLFHEYEDVWIKLVAEYFYLRAEM